MVRIDGLVGGVLGLILVCCTFYYFLFYIKFIIWIKGYINLCFEPNMNYCVTEWLDLMILLEEC
jgi:hypothetical protein